MEKKLPEGMIPLGKSTFMFRCGPDLSCFKSCCRKLEMTLYPYDIIRLKRKLGISSDEFIRNHTRLGQSSHPFFPALMLNMADNAEHSCPFLNKDGCMVYEDRPWACRMYPLERGVDRMPGRHGDREFYFMTNHPYCFGHKENTEWTVKTWLRDQKVLDFNVMNDLWAEMDTLFSTNPWQGEGAAGSRQQIAFMACYNIDAFRVFVDDVKLLDRFKLGRSKRRQIEQEDEALLRFGFDWLKHVLAGEGSLKPKQ